MDTQTHSWLESLTEETRQRVFATMRDIDGRAQRYYQNSANMTRGSGMSIPIGAAGFDEFIRGDSLATYLRGLRKGLAPTEAIESAKVSAREVVKSHNTKRAKDVCWQRADMTADSTIEYAHQQIVDSLVGR